MTAQWYALRVVTGKEIKWRESLMAMNLEVRLPMSDKMVMLPDSNLPVRGVMIKGYVFVKMLPSEWLYKQILLLGNRHGFVKLLPKPSSPLPIEESVFEKMCRACDDVAQSSDDAPDLGWMLWQTFVIESGSWAGYSGLCVDFSSAGAPKILLPVFKQMLPVPVDVAHICLTPVAKATQDHVVKTRLFGYKGKQKIAR